MPTVRPERVEGDGWHNQDRLVEACGELGEPERLARSGQACRRGNVFNPFRPWFDGPVLSLVEGLTTNGV